MRPAAGFKRLRTHRGGDTCVAHAHFRELQRGPTPLEFADAKIPRTPIQSPSANPWRGVLVSLAWLLPLPHWRSRRLLGKRRSRGL